MPKTKKKSKKQLEALLSNVHSRSSWTDFCQDELQKAAEEQKRHEEKERLFKLEEAGQMGRGCFLSIQPGKQHIPGMEDALAAHRERLEIELEGKNRVLEAERLEAAFFEFRWVAIFGFQEEQEVVARPAVILFWQQCPVHSCVPRNEGRTEAVPGLRAACNPVLLDDAIDAFCFECFETCLGRSCRRKLNGRSLCPAHHGPTSCGGLNKGACGPREEAAWRHSCQAEGMKARSRPMSQWYVEALEELAKCSERAMQLLSSCR